VRAYVCVCVRVCVRVLCVVCLYVGAGMGVSAGVGVKGLGLFVKVLCVRGRGYVCLYHVRVFV